MNAEPFHVVDVLPHVGLEHDPTIDQCTRLDVAELYSANANCNAARPFEPALEQKEIAVRQQVGIAHVEIFGALDRKAPRSWSADQKRPQVPFASRPRSEMAISVPESA